MRVVKARRAESVFIGGISRDVLRAIFSIHFSDAHSVLDMTWGKGAFWNWDHGLDVVGVDKLPEKGALILADSRWLPVRSASVDVAVVDPPFLHETRSVGRPSTQKMLTGRDYESCHNQSEVTGLYDNMIREGRRVARRGIIVKCKDIIESGHYIPRLWSVTTTLLSSGAEIVDVLVLVPKQKMADAPSWGRQQHTRRAESYFVVAKIGGAERQMRRLRKG